MIAVEIQHQRKQSKLSKIVDSIREFYWQHKYKTTELINAKINYDQFYKLFLLKKGSLLIELLKSKEANTNHNLDLLIRKIASSNIKTMIEVKNKAESTDISKKIGTHFRLCQRAIKQINLELLSKILNCSDEACQQVIDISKINPELTDKILLYLIMSNSKFLENPKNPERRLFTKNILTVGTLAIIPKINMVTNSFNATDKDKSKEKKTEIKIPPSLMLHSYHGLRKNYEPLARLLDLIVENGFIAMSYKQWLNAINSGNLPDKPILISCDDLTLVKSINNIESFRSIKDELFKRNMSATFALITEPILEIDGSMVVQNDQDPKKWKEIAEWTTQNMEIATHSSHHTNLNGPDSKPSDNLSDTDYYQEIVASTTLIQELLLSNGVNYKVETFITPFGSGFSYSQDTQEIHEEVTSHCLLSGIKVVVGIAGGRKPIESQIFTKDDPVYVGRIQPAENNDHIIDAEATMRWLNNWHNAS